MLYMHHFDAFFDPKAVAIVGASADPQKAGHIIFRNFVEGGFRGKTFPVNPAIPDLLGHKCYKSVRDVPYPLDLVVIASPAETVPKVMEECAQKKVKAAIIISSGFAEAGKPALEARIRKVAASANILLLGPNCLGVYDPFTLTDTLFLPRLKLERPGRGAIFLASQSGALGAWLLDKAAQKGYGLSHFISYGNAAGIDQADIITYAAADERTRAVVLHLEGVKDGRKLFTAISQSRKPLIIVKTARTPVGAAAAQQHTAAPPTDSLFDDVMKQAGAILAPDMDTALDIARLLAAVPASGHRVQVITGGGGVGVALADALHTAGLPLAQPSKATVIQFHSLCPHLTGTNPVDTGGNTTASLYRSLVDVALADPAVDIVVLIAVLQVPSVEADIVSALSSISKHKPVLVLAGGGRYTEGIRKSLEVAGILTFDTVTGLAAVLSALHQRTEQQKVAQARRIAALQANQVSSAAPQKKQPAPSSPPGKHHQAASQKGKHPTKPKGNKKSQPHPSKSKSLHKGKRR